MKHVLIFIVVIISSVSVTAQWNIAAYVQSDYTNRILAVNADTIFRIGGSDYNIYRSVNGGSIWNETETDFEYSFLVDMSFPTNTTGYVCGGTYFGNYRTCLLRTDDAGTSWDTISANQFPSSMFFNKVCFVTEEIGFLSNDASQFLKTIDGGNSFTEMDLNSGLNLLSVLDVDFYDEQIGFASVYGLDEDDNTIAKYHIYKTIDQGESWMLVYEDEVQNATSATHRRIHILDVIDENHVVGSGENSGFIRTEDGGDNWSYTTIVPGTSYLDALDFVTPEIGFINNAGIIHKSIDGGDNWYIQTAFPTAIVFSISMVDENLGFFLSSDAVYKTTTSGEVVSVEELLQDAFVIYPNPATSIITIEGDNIQRVVSAKIKDSTGRIVKTLGDNELSFSIQDIANGIYILTFQVDGKMYSKKLVIKR